MSHVIEYGTLMHNAMRSLIQQVLTDVAEHGLPGAHHFFITFNTQHPEAKLAVWLCERYPDEMTVVMQHDFEALEVTDAGFSITLSFGDEPETLYIPYEAIETFVDPSVEFGLRFEANESDDDEDTADVTTLEEAPMHEAAEDDTPHEADVVSLDHFRK